MCPVTAVIRCHLDFLRNDPKAKTVSPNNGLVNSVLQVLFEKPVPFRHAG